MSTISISGYVPLLNHKTLGVIALGIIYILMKGTTMSESTTISISKKLPLAKRISNAKKKISKWTDSLDNPFDDKTDAIQLTKFDRNDDEFLYQYIIVRGAKISRKRW